MLFLGVCRGVVACRCHSGAFVRDVHRATGRGRPLTPKKQLVVPAEDYELSMSLDGPSATLRARAFAARVYGHPVIVAINKMDASGVQFSESRFHEVALRERSHLNLCFSFFPSPGLVPLNLGCQARE